MAASNVSELRAAIAQVGSGHVAWLLADWPRRAEAAWRGAWAANHMPNWHAYARLLEAGASAVRAALQE